MHEYLMVCVQVSPQLGIVKRTGSPEDFRKAEAKGSPQPLKEVVPSSSVQAATGTSMEYTPLDRAEHEHI